MQNIFYHKLQLVFLISVMNTNIMISWVEHLPVFKLVQSCGRGYFHMVYCIHVIYDYLNSIYVHIQGVSGGICHTSGEHS